MKSEAAWRSPPEGGAYELVLLIASGDTGDCEEVLGAVAASANVSEWWPADGAVGDFPVSSDHVGQQALKRVFLGVGPDRGLRCALHAFADPQADYQWEVRLWTHLSEIRHSYPLGSLQHWNRGGVSHPATQAWFRSIAEQAYEAAAHFSLVVIGWEINLDATGMNALLAEPGVLVMDEIGHRLVERV